jgi:hypothetical protein
MSPPRAQGHACSTLGICSSHTEAPRVCVGRRKVEAGRGPTDIAPLSIIPTHITLMNFRNRFVNT